MHEMTWGRCNVGYFNMNLVTCCDEQAHDPKRCLHPHPGECGPLCGKEEALKLGDFPVLPALSPNLKEWGFPSGMLKNLGG